VNAVTVTPSPEIFYHNTFGNLLLVQFTNGVWVTTPVTDISYYSNYLFVTLQTIVATNSPLSPVGSPPTISTFNRTVLAKDVTGEYVLLPPGDCAVSIISPLLTNVFITTNLIATVTNIASVSTNGVGTTNTQFITENEVTYFTNHVFVAYPVTCVATNAALRQGMGVARFVRHDFVSLDSRVFQPVTNIYHLKAVVNNQVVDQAFQRIVTRPDFLFTARDLGGPPGIFPLSVFAVVRSINFNQNNILPGLAGPGTIEPQWVIALNKVGPILLNTYPALDETTGGLIFQWGSFDGTTNDPIVYPQGTSIKDLENQVLMAITSPLAVAGVVGTAFSLQLTGTGGSPPYTWSLGPGSPGLPPGFDALQPDGTIANGIISGTPIQPGTFNVLIHMADSGGRSIDRQLTIIISP
jgi:hypothetical protein